MTGRTRTTRSCLEWTATLFAPRAPVPSLEASTDPTWTVYRVEASNSERDATYVLTLVAGQTFRSSQSAHSLPACADGLVVDVAVDASLGRLRVIGVASTARSPDLWSDAETPTFEGYRLEFSLHSDDFWLGLFLPDSD